MTRSRLNFTMTSFRTLLTSNPSNARAKPFRTHEPSETKVIFDNMHSAHTSQSSAQNNAINHQSISQRLRLVRRSARLVVSRWRCCSGQRWCAHRCSNRRSCWCFCGLQRRLRACSRLLLCLLLLLLRARAISSAQHAMQAKAREEGSVAVCESNTRVQRRGKQIPN